jgi:hypothetical protein
MKLLAEHRVHQLFELRPCIGLEFGASSANVAGVEVVGNSDADEDGERLASIIGDGIVTLINGVPVRTSPSTSAGCPDCRKRTLPPLCRCPFVQQDGRLLLEAQSA